MATRDNPFEVGAKDTPAIPEGYIEIDPADIQEGDILEMGHVRWIAIEGSSGVCSYGKGRVTHDYWLFQHQVQENLRMNVEWHEDIRKIGAHLFRKREPRVVEFAGRVERAPHVCRWMIDVLEADLRVLKGKYVKVHVEEILG